MTNGGGELLLYTDDNGAVRFHVRLVDETVWLSQALLAQLFGKDVRTISEHLQNLFEEGELDRDATVRKFRIVRTEGSREVSREVEHYALPAILAVGYRVRSPQGTRFRQWATERLAEFVVKGFTMDDERLKSRESADYFDELLERAAPNSLKQHVPLLFGTEQIYLESVPGGWTAGGTRAKRGLLSN